jgi:hypothetical protein
VAGKRGARGVTLSWTQITLAIVKGLIFIELADLAHQTQIRLLESWGLECALETSKLDPV